MRIRFVSTLALLLLVALAPALSADEKPATPGGDPKKEFMDFIKQQRTKKWEFEDKMLQKNRQFQDESRKAGRDAELEDEATLASGTDLKASRKLVQQRRSERQKAWQKTMTNNNKSNGQARKEFHAQMENERKTFHAAHQPVSDSGKKKPADKKKK